MKKGFTLIELLAVIVILAVIALIAVPLILSLVDKSRRKATEESAILYVDTIENMLMINTIENTDGKTYKVKGRTVIDEKDKVILNLEIKGDVPYSGVDNEIKINSGFIETANLRFNSYYVHYEMDMTTKKFKTCTSQKGFLDTCDGTGEVKPTEPEPPKVESGATIEMAKDKTYLAVVYLDPTDLSKKCTKEEAEANVNEYGTPTTIKAGCMKWYAYKEDDKNYTMILDHNTSGNVAWNSTLTNNTDVEHKMGKVKEQLEEDTKNWITSIKDTARLISALEIAELTGASKDDTLAWKADKFVSQTTYLLANNKEQYIGWYYLSGKGSTYTSWQNRETLTSGSSRFAWLFDYLNGCTNATVEYGCSSNDLNKYPVISSGSSYNIEGYWTNTLFLPENVYDHVFRVAIVNSGGRVGYSAANDTFNHGIRPVIEIPKI